MINKYIAFLFLIIGLGGMSAHAQQPSFTFYEVEGGFDRAQLKEVMIAVNDLDPTGGVFHSDDMTILQIKVSPTISDEQLRAVISGTGLSLLAGTPDLNAKYGEAPDVPLYISTGDPKADHARYAAEVEEYNSLHPENKMPEPIPYMDEQ